MNTENPIRNWLYIAFMEPENRLNESFYFDRRNNVFYSVFITDYWLTDPDSDLELLDAPYTSAELATLSERIDRQEDGSPFILSIPRLTEEDRAVLVGYAPEEQQAFVQGKIDSFCNLNGIDLTTCFLWTQKKLTAYTINIKESPANPLHRIKEFLTGRSSISIGYRDLHFLDAAKLREEQVGFRFHPNGNSLVTGKEGAWKKEWVVIATDELGDPILVDTNGPLLPVLTAPHGMGSWEPYLIADSLDNLEDIVFILTQLSKNRSSPIDLKNNPISSRERKKALQRIERENPNSDLDYWAFYMENETDDDDDDDIPRKPWWKFW